MRTVALTTALSSSLLGPLALSQSVPAKALAAPTASYAEPFTHVASIREQSDGRVVVLDDYESRIVHLDFRTGTATALGRKGRGPGEFTLPQHLVALAADTTLAVEMGGGGQAVVISPKGMLGTPLRSAGVDAGKPLFMRSEIQSDARGWIYELASRITVEDGRRMQSRSDGVRRLDRVTGRVDTIGAVSRQLVSSLVDVKPANGKYEASAGGAARSGGAPPPYSSAALWAVAPDGRIAIVTPNPYHVTFYETDGKLVEGASIAYTPTRLTEGLKEEWRARAKTPVLTLTFGRDQTVSGGTSIPKFREPDEWPDVLPPFILRATARYAPDGMLWVERTTQAGAPQTFDVIDRTGRVASRVVMPPHTRLVGFGNRTVYAVRIDDDDLQYLQRYALP